MFRIFSVLLSGLMVWATAGPAVAYYPNTQSPIWACKQAIQERTGSSRLSNVTTQQRGPEKFRVYGIVRIHGEPNPSFTCKVKRGYVTNLSIDGPQQPNYPPYQNHSDGDKVGAVLAGALLGGIVAAAASSHHHHDDYRPHSGYKPNFGPGPVATGAFYPAPGITCYRSQRACYRNGGGYSARWTHREFGW